MTDYYGEPEELIAELIAPGEALGAPMDILDPLGLRHVPGRIADRWIDKRTHRAADVVQGRVHQGVRTAVSDAAKTAGAIALGSILAGALVGGAYYWRRRKNRSAR